MWGNPSRLQAFNFVTMAGTIIALVFYLFFGLVFLGFSRDELSGLRGRKPIRGVSYLATSLILLIIATFQAFELYEIISKP